MNSFNRKLFACLMAACMLLTLMPFAAAEDIPSITEESHLIQAAANGGVYSIDSVVDVVEGPITVKKDLTLHLGADIQMLNYSSEAVYETLFIVEGATLTIKEGLNGRAACISYSGNGSAVTLVGAETQTALVSEAGSWYGVNLNKNGELYSPASLIDVEQAAGTLQPTIEINGGYYQAQDTTHQWTGALVSGDAPKLSIGGGNFGVDVSDYLAEGLVCLSRYGQYTVLALDETFSDEFTLTDKEGVLKLNRFETTEETIDLLIDMLYTTYGYPNDDGKQEYEFFADSYDFENHTLYVSRTNEYGNLLETHLIQLEYVYDTAIKAQVDALVDTLPKPEYDPEAEAYLYHYYAVNDLELINYWLTCTEENEEYNVNNLINYSKELKEYIGYRNFKLDARMGWGERFETATTGIAEFKYGDTVYAVMEMGAKAQHVVYVPDDTTDVLAAVQSRIDAYLGEGKVTVESAGPVIDVIWYEHYLGSQGEWSQTDPDMTYEEWKQSVYAPTYTAAEDTGLEWLKDDDACFTTTINGYQYYLLAVKDSSKITDAPTYKSVDVTTEVGVLTDDSSVPLDTMIEVETMTEGEDYERIMAALNVEEHETYNIKLYSGSKEDYVTSLESGEFEVQIPVSEQLVGKDLVAYYVDAEGAVTEYEVTVEEGIASFTTDHFSAYTLAAKTTAAPCDHAFAWDEESMSYLCSACGAAYEQNLDLDGNGFPTTADAILLLRTISKAVELPAYVADINSDGKVKIFDAVRYLQLLNE